MYVELGSSDDEGRAQPTGLLPPAAAREQRRQGVLYLESAAEPGPGVVASTRVSDLRDTDDGVVRSFDAQRRQLRAMLA